MVTDTDRPQRPGGEEEAPKAVPLLALNSEALLAWFGGVLATRAWVDMGLLADPIKGEVVRDLTSARLAIDAYDCLVKTLKAKGRPDGVREMEALLADLRLNFVRQAAGE